MPDALPPTALTVYSQGFAIVKEARRLDLQEGRQTVGVEDVAAKIDPSSVAIRSLDPDNPIGVLEQNYQYDLIGPAAILAKAVGERLRVVGEEETVEGILISSPGQNGGGLVLRTDDGRIVLDPKGQITLGKVPEGLITRPTLLWDLTSGREGETTVELSYITEGFTWNADYVLTLGDGDTATLQGWVTVVNDSGTTYRDARLKLLAGDVNVAQTSVNESLGVRTYAALSLDQTFEEEPIFEYHLYTLPRPTTLANRETKQLGLLHGDAVRITKRILVDALHGRTYRPQEHAYGTGEVQPQVEIELTNDEASSLGMPLPAGRYRVYGNDSSGATQLLGEDQAGHTPRGERVRLGVGRSFDVRATRRRESYEALGKRAARESFAIDVRNRKMVPETVEVVERLSGDWRITAQNEPYERVDSETVRFTLLLAPDETKTVTYTVESRW